MDLAENRIAKEHLLGRFHIIMWYLTLMNISPPSCSLPSPGTDQATEKATRRPQREDAFESTPAASASRSQLPLDVLGPIARGADGKTFVTMLQMSPNGPRLLGRDALENRLWQHHPTGSVPFVDLSVSELAQQCIFELHRADLLRAQIRFGKDVFASHVAVSCSVFSPTEPHVMVGDRFGSVVLEPLIGREPFGSASLRALYEKWQHRAFEPRFGLVEARESEIRRLQFSRDGNTLMTVFGDEVVHIRHLQSGDLQYCGLPTGDSFPSTSLPLLSANGHQVLLPVGWQSELIAMRWSRGGLAPKYEEFRPQWGESTHLECIDMSPDARYVAAAARSSGGQLALWDTAQSPMEMHRLDQAGFASQVQFSPNSKLFAVLRNSGMALWNLGADTGAPPLLLLHTNASAALKCAFSPNDERLATFGDGELQVYDLLKRPLHPVFQGFTQHRGIRKLAFSPNGQFIAASTFLTHVGHAGGAEDAVHVWDLFKQEQHTTEFRVPKHHLKAWEFSPDSRFILLQIQDKLHWRNMPGMDV